MQLPLFLASVKSPALPPLHVANRFLKAPVRFPHLLPSLKAEPAWFSCSHPSGEIAAEGHCESCTGKPKAETRSGECWMDWKRNPFLWSGSYTLPVQPSSCLVSCCKTSVKYTEQITEWSGLHLCRCNHVVPLFQGTVLAWVFLSRKQHWRILFTFKNICTLAYQVTVSIQCGTCLEFLPDTKSLRFFKSCC